MMASSPGETVEAVEEAVPSRLLVGLGHDRLRVQRPFRAAQSTGRSVLNGSTLSLNAAKLSRTARMVTDLHKRGGRGAVQAPARPRPAGLGRALLHL
jgi:hypothetical protein